MKTTDLLKKLGYRVRSLRNAHGLSQEKLAELAGVHPTYISEVELGKANASITVLEGVATGLRITLPELFQFQDGEEDAAFMALIAHVRSLNVQQRKTFIETATVVLKGMQEF